MLESIKNIFFAIALLMALISIASYSPLSDSSQQRTFEVTSISKWLEDSALKSVSGQDIKVYHFPHAREFSSEKFRHDAPYRFLIQGGLHGNEFLTAEFVKWLQRRYAGGHSLLNHLPYEKVSFDFIPVVNPDGFDQGSRYNQKGVNLNRNFGVLYGKTRENPGEKAFSEPETQALKALIEKRRYTAAIDVHGYVPWVVLPSEPKHLSQRVSESQQARYFSWKNLLTENLKILGLDYKLKTAGGLGDGGAFEDWTFWSQKTLSFCLEMKSPQRVGGSKDSFLVYERFIYKVLGALTNKG